MNTVREVFDAAIMLMDEQNESSGSTDTADTKVYALRAPTLLNTILDQCLSASVLQPETKPGERPTVPKVHAMEDEIQLDEVICIGILPYGLAALLLTEEDPVRSNFFNQTFLEKLMYAAHNRPSVESSIVDVYGGIEFGQFGHW